MSEHQGWDIVAYRVEQLERQLSNFMNSMFEKLDTIAQHQTSLITTQATQQTQINTLKETVKEQGDQIDSLEKTVTDVRITMAEKLIPGAAAGAAITGMLELLKYLAGGG